ncbi:hypothetical protein ACTXT7_004820 [Hymenolepis weldensis]
MKRKGDMLILSSYIPFTKSEWLFFPQATELIGVGARDVKSHVMEIYVMQGSFSSREVLQEVNCHLIPK